VGSLIIYVALAIENRYHDAIVRNRGVCGRWMMAAQVMIWLMEIMGSSRANDVDNDVMYGAWVMLIL
jgi:hypothetical protein